MRKRGSLTHREPCTFCGVHLDTRDPGVFQRTSGWVENRTAGGANTVALNTREPVWSCGDCINRLRRGVSPDQGRML